MVAGDGALRPDSARRPARDLRVSKILRYGRTRTQIGLDVYNLTNTDVVTSYNENFVANGAWLRPTGIQPARYMKIGAQVDF
jgi:outer membrane receptor protein involved in Fe transport